MNFHRYLYMVMLFGSYSIAMERAEENTVTSSDKYTSNLRRSVLLPRESEEKPQVDVDKRPYFLEPLEAQGSDSTIKCALENYQLPIVILKQLALMDDDQS